MLVRDIIRGNGIFWLALTKFKEIKYSLCDNIVRGCSHITSAVGGGGGGMAIADHC